jgi:hypothetical protein
MENYKIVKYSSLNYVEWNEFVSKAKNATFLFHRDFMDYHKDRFEDFSVLLYYRQELVAILPANLVNNRIVSHQGLTYGGLVLKKDIKFQTVIEIFQALLKFFKLNNCNNLEIKLLPAIYSQFPNDEINYILFLLKATLIKRETLSVVNQNRKLKFSNNRIEGYKRGLKNKLVVVEENSLDTFWNKILIPNLKLKHKVNPVHNLEEITLLKSLFPNNIRQFNVYFENNIVAGVTIFETEEVAHCQYISGNEEKNTLGSLDLLHYYLINEVFSNKKYFDFGTSNEHNGTQINKGLQFWKEGFGARTVVQDLYKVKIDNYKLLDGVLI